MTELSSLPEAELHDLGRGQPEGKLMFYVETEFQSLLLSAQHLPPALNRALTY